MWWVTTDVAFSVCGRSSLWPFRFVAVSVCGRSGLWPFRSVAVLVCGPFGLWPFRLWPFRFVAVMTCYPAYQCTVSQVPMSQVPISIPWHREYWNIQLKAHMKPHSIKSSNTPAWAYQMIFHDDVIKWKYFPRYGPFGRGIPRSPANSPHKCQWRGALMFSLISAWINSWVNNREAGDLRRNRAHYDVTVMHNSMMESASKE